MNFRPDSYLGVPGIFDVYRAGGITIANAPGTGVADDKAIYSYMPDIVEFYTGEKPLLENVPTWRCSDPESLKHVLDNLEELVVKEVHGSGGYGMLIGPTASKREIREFRTKLEGRPANYIAQPTLALSTVPIFEKAGLAPRHVDLRPFVLVSPGGDRDHAGRPDAGGAQERVAGRELLAGRGHQGHLGAGGGLMGSLDLRRNAASPDGGAR